LSQYRPGMFLENQAGRRKQHAFAAALKESNTKPSFEVADLLRYGRLRNAKAIRRAAKISRLCDGQEIPQVTHLNRIMHRAQTG
jgi:hypothetical protein